MHYKDKIFSECRAHFQEFCHLFHLFFIYSLRTRSKKAEKVLSFARLFVTLHRFLSKILITYLILNVL